MNYLLILDDDRSIEQVKNISPKPFELYPELPIVLVKDFKEGQGHLVNAEGQAVHLCLDWNLYSSPNHMNLTGYDFVQWLVHYDECRKKVLVDDFSFTCHSSDEEWKAKMEKVLQEYKES